MPPKVVTKNGDRAGGVLPVSAAARTTPVKAPTAKLKLEIRRLPPGLTLTEFEEALGDEWKLGNGKVDWREYRQGKVKTSAGKIPEQSRCYLHLVNEPLLKEFEARFLNVTFVDKAGTHRNHDVRNFAPTLGFAPNQRTPLNVKVRTDNRQGTIDQEPEFIAFLESETQPIVKPAALDTVGAEKKETEKVGITSTPLIDALREKKANKAKAAASKEEKKEAKGHTKGESKDTTASDEKPAKDGKGSHKKGEQATKDGPKAANKQILTKQQQPRAASPQQAPAKVASPAKSKKVPPSPKAQNAILARPANAAATTAVTASQSPAPQRAPRQRGNADGIKKMLQKDLGIRPKAAAPANTNAASSTPSTTPSNNPKSPPPQTNSAANSAPTAAVKSPQSANKPSTPSAGPVPSPTKAYLKHANPSQGMTEILIQQALSQFGDVTNVTIDPRKGTAIAIFKDTDSLKKAIETKKVPVANGTVEVLEFKDRSNAGGGGGGGGGSGGGGGGRGGFRGGKGGGRGGKGGGHGSGHAASASTANASAAPASAGAGAAASAAPAGAGKKADGGT